MSEYLQPGEFNLTPEQIAYWWEQLEIGEKKVNYARRQLGLDEMETNNGQLAAERIAAEFTAEEAERHRLWRIAVLGQHVAEMGYTVDE